MSSWGISLYSLLSMYFPLSSWQAWGWRPGGQKSTNGMPFLVVSPVCSLIAVFFFIAPLAFTFRTESDGEGTGRRREKRKRRRCGLGKSGRVRKKRVDVVRDEVASAGITGYWICRIQADRIRDYVQESGIGMPRSTRVSFPSGTYCVISGLGCKLVGTSLRAVFPTTARKGSRKLV